MVRPRLGFSYGLVVTVLRPMLVAFTRRDWRGGHHLPPTGGVVVCTNHVSYFDPLSLAHFVLDNGRLPRFLAKEAVFRVPLIGRVIRGAGQIPVHRSAGDAASALRDAVSAVEVGECVAIYPEGTITRDPLGWPMVGKTGAARVALATGCPVIPVAQWGPQDVLAPYAKRPRLLPRKTMHVSAGPPVDLSDLVDVEVTGEVLHEATERIMTAITGLLEEVRDDRAPAERYDPRRTDLPAARDPGDRPDERRSA